MRKAFRTQQSIPWADIEKAHTYIFLYVRSVALNLTPEGALRHAKGKYFARMSVGLGNGWIADRTYSADEFAALINSYLSTFRSAEEGGKFRWPAVAVIILTSGRFNRRRLCGGQRLAVAMAAGAIPADTDLAASGFPPLTHTLTN